MSFKITKRPRFLTQMDKAKRDVENVFKKELLLHTTGIHSNVQDGKNFEGKKLRSYSASYAKQRTREGLQTTPTTLTRTGGMLNAMKHEVKRVVGGNLEGRIFFSNAKQRALASPNSKKKVRVSAAEKAKFVLDLGFNFFGISKKQVEEIQKKCLDAFKGGLFK